MKHFDPLTAAAMIGAVLASSGPAFAVGDETTPMTPLTMDLVTEVEGYPNPGTNYHAYPAIGHGAYYNTAQNPTGLWSRQSAAAARCRCRVEPKAAQPTLRSRRYGTCP